MSNLLHEMPSQSFDCRCVYLSQLATDETLEAGPGKDSIVHPLFHFSFWAWFFFSPVMGGYHSKDHLTTGRSDLSFHFLPSLVPTRFGSAPFPAFAGAPGGSAGRRWLWLWLFHVFGVSIQGRIVPCHPRGAGGACQNQFQGRAVQITLWTGLLAVVFSSGKRKKIKIKQQLASIGGGGPPWQKMGDARRPTIRGPRARSLEWALAASSVSTSCSRRRWQPSRLNHLEHVVGPGKSNPDR